MSVFIDRKYLKLISSKLSRFSQKKEDLYNFRCPFCGDSKKNQLKARGYVYRKKNDYFYKCQNCGVGYTMYNFLNYLDGNLAKDYSLERFTNGETGNHNYPKPELKFDTPKFTKSKTVINLPSIKELEKDHIAVQYCIGRKIPEDTYDNLYYAEDFKNFVYEILPDCDKDLKENDPRLIIPFFNEENQLVAFQGRTLTDSNIRYITIKVSDEAIKLFGLNKINKEEKIYVTEGPIDSLFLPNSIATADSNLMSAGNHISRDKLVLIFDNEPRNKEVMKLMQNAIKSDQYVVIWPNTMNGKDINEMIMNGLTQSEIQEIISSNSFKGLEAQAKFTFWKKV